MTDGVYTLRKSEVVERHTCIVCDNVIIAHIPDKVISDYARDELLVALNEAWSSNYTGEYDD